MFKIQDESGKVYNTVIRPTAVYDAHNSVLLKIGEYENMVDYFNTVEETYRSHGFHDVADDICLMELPKVQEEIDKAFQITNYIGKLHKQALY